MLPSRYRHATYLLTLALSLTQMLTGCTSAPWNKEYHLRSWERYRLDAEKAFLKKNYSEAESQYLLAIEEARKIAESPPFHLGISLVDLGKCFAFNKHPQSRQVLNDAIAVLEPAVNRNDSSITNELLLQNLAKAKMTLANLSLEEGDLPQAKMLYLEGLAMLDHWRVDGTDRFEDNMLGQDAATSLARLGEICAKSGQAAEGKRYFEQALLVSRNAAGPFKTTQKIAQDYCALLKASGETQKAADFNAGKAWINYTIAAVKCTEAEDASAEGEALHNKALIEANKPGQSELNKVLTLRSLARIYYCSRRYQKCNEVCTEALKLAENSTSANQYIIDSLLERAVGSYNSNGQYEEAVATAKRLLALREKTFGADNLRTAEYHVHLAALYHQLGNKAESLKESQIAFKAFGHSRPWRYKRILIMELLTSVLMEQERFDQAYIIVKDAMSMHSSAMRYKPIFRAQLRWRLYLMAKIQNPSQDCSNLKEQALRETIALDDRQQNSIKGLLDKWSLLFDKSNLPRDAESLRQTAASLPRNEI